MKISEIFYSIQGEGKLLGMPSVFVRVSGCNLRCTWCDTPYASWHANTPDARDREMSVEEILHEMDRLAPGATHVVLTGGEPMMFKELVTLIAALKQRNMHVTVETAGTLWLENLPAASIDLASISPKLSNSTPREREGGRFATLHDRQRLNFDVLKSFATGSVGVIRECQWKFVISSREDFAEMQTLIDDLNNQLPLADKLKPADILLMPEGTDASALNHRSVEIAELCKAHGYRFTPRLHVYLWGNTRGT